MNGEIQEGFLKSKTCEGRCVVWGGVVQVEGADGKLTQVRESHMQRPWGKKEDSAFEELGESQQDRYV